MNANFKDNNIHINLLKLTTAIQETPAMATLMQPATLEKVQAMAARVWPLMRAADATATLPEAKRKAALAEVRMRTGLKQLQLAVLFQFPELPDSLSGLVRMRLATSIRENMIRLHTILGAVRAMPGFIYPPGFTDAALEQVLADARETHAALAAVKARSKEAAKELRVLRPQVKEMWKKLGLNGWITANVAEADRVSYGQEPKKRRKAAGEEDITVLPFSMGTTPVPKPVVEQPAKEPTRTVTPPAPAPFPNLGQSKPPVLASSTGSNGYSSNGTNGHSSNGVNGHGTAVIF